jgi:hypothetical protein
MSRRKLPAVVDMEQVKKVVFTIEIILKPVWFLAFQKTKSWLQLSPDWKTPRTFPGQKAPRTLLGQNCFWIYSESYFEKSIKRALNIRIIPVS